MQQQKNAHSQGNVQQPNKEEEEEMIDCKIINIKRKNKKEKTIIN